ncbi:MAG: hypothetical protein WA231_01275 [Methylocella sp.]
MIIALYIAAAVIMAVGSPYFAWRSRDVRKFLAGAFFVSSGILFYLYLADVSVPLLGTSFVETPQISGGRSIVHFILFFLCFYFGFVNGRGTAGEPGEKKLNGVATSLCAMWVSSLARCASQQGGAVPCHIRHEFEP